MCFINLRRRMFKPLLFLLAGMILSLAVIYSCSISVFADDPSPVRIPGFETTATSSISHSHRGSRSTGGQCYTIPVIHQHSGSSSSRGGCYNRAHYHSHNGSCYGTCTYEPSYVGLQSSEQNYCSQHGSVVKANYLVILTHSGGCGDTSEYRYVSINCNVCGGNPATGLSGSHQYLNCNRGGTVEYYELSCGMSAGSSIDHYDPGCEMEDRVYGDISLTNTTPEWTSGNVTLIGALNDPEGTISQNGFGQMSFSPLSGQIESSSDDSITVSENGVYSMDISVDESIFDTAQASVMLTVANIDRTEPEISDVSYDNGETWLRTNDITITASDLQPDGSPGSGLADAAFSFDGGATWQSDPTYTVDSNRTVDISVKDYCGNISTVSADITNIDNIGPVISYSRTPEPWYSDSGERIYTFTAEDEQSGLDDLPFSYDDGETWTDSEELPTPKSGVVHVTVRDKLGNTSELYIKNDYDKRPAPRPDGQGGEGGEPENTDPDNNPGNNDGNGQAEDDGSGDPSDDNTDNDPSDNPDDNDQNSAPGTPEGDNNDGGSSDGSDNNASSESMDHFSGDMNDGSADEDISDTVVYFEQLPTSSAAIDISRHSDSISEMIPFYMTKAFKVAVTLSGGMLASAVLFILFFLLYSGVIIYSFDTNRYRLMGLRPIRRSERGNCIHLSREFMDNAYSSRYKLKMGKFYTMRHKDDLFNIDADGDWVSVKVDRNIYVVLK